MRRVRRRVERAADGGAWRRALRAVTARRRVLQLELGAEGVEEPVQTTPESGHAHERDDGDERDQQAVLGHGLTLFTLELDAHQLEPITKLHLAPPFGGGGADVAQVKMPSPSKACGAKREDHPEGLRESLEMRTSRLTTENGT